MNDNKKFTWNFTVTYVPTPYDYFYKSTEQTLEDQLGTMTEYPDAMAVIDKAKHG